MNQQQQRQEKLVKLGYSFEDTTFLKEKQFSKVTGFSVLNHNGFWVGDYERLGNAINAAEKSLKSIVNSYNTRSEWLHPNHIRHVENHHELISGFCDVDTTTPYGNMGAEHFKKERQ